jgi:hypothetical protein
MAGGKGRKRKAPTKRDNPAQSEKFIRAAKELGLDETGKTFDEVMDAILPKKRPLRGNMKK